MSKTELSEYIANRKYQCPLCIELQKRVAESGVDAISEWDGMICGSIEDMIIRLSECDV